METIQVDAQKYLALIKLERNTERDKWYDKERELKTDLQTAKDGRDALYKSLAKCSCGEMTKTSLVYTPNNYKSGSGDGYGYYECPECKKRWVLRELLPAED